MNTRRLRLWLHLLAGGVLMLAVWVLLVWVSARPALRSLIDLTPQRVNSVDPATEDLLRELRAQGAKVELHLFVPMTQGEGGDEFSRQALSIRRRLVDLTRTLLVRYQHLGGESVEVIEHDLYGAADRAREAAQRFSYKAGEGETLIVAVTMPGKEPRHRKLSIVAEMADIDVPSIPQPGASTGLPVLKDYRGELVISSALKGLLVQGTPVAYVMKGMSPVLDLTRGNPMSYGTLIDALASSGFDVLPLAFDERASVPDDATVVLILEPQREFTDREAEALFAYLRRGGRVLLNYSWAGEDDMNPTGGRLGELLGFEMGRRPVFHTIPDPRLGSGVRGLDGSPGVQTLHLQYVRTLHPLTQRWAQNGRPLEVKGAREVREIGGQLEGIRHHPLLVTGDQAWLARVEQGHVDFRAPNVGLRQFLVGMAISVDTEDATDVGGAGRDAKVKDAAPRTGELLIVSGIFATEFGMQAGFGDFAVNACNWMAERKVLLDIRGARYEARYIDLKQPQLDRIGNLLVYYVPGVFLLLGAIVWWRRRH